MLGVDQMWNFVVGESFPLTQGLHALPTIFGAVVSGCQDPLALPTSNIPETLMIVHEVQDPTRPPTTVEELEEAVEAIWTPDPDIKAAGASKELASKTNAEVTQEFKANITKKPDGYYVRFPWKGVPGDVPNNFGITIKRLLSNWEFLRKKPQILDKYHAIFMDQLEKGMIETVDPRKPCEARVHYLPHQAVLTPEKATTKVRPVFDASAHLRGCPSLNDTMYQGPSLIPLILGIMLRIRTGRILLLADVEKAFLQIKLHTSERDAVRFILLKDPNKKPDRDNWVIYRYTCVPFGITASPFLLGATIEHHLRKTLHDEMFIKQLIQNTYVDNVILTVDNPEKAIEVARICKKVFSEASMNLREFMTNDKIVWHQIPVKNRSYLPGQKILGTTWDSETDGFRLHVKTNPPVKKTKRGVASAVHAIYDPLGLLSPLLIEAKGFLQGLWAEYDWDKKLETKLWVKFLEILDRIDDFQKSIPRCLSEIGKPIDLIVFSDANQNTMATCLYLVNTRTANLLISQTKMRPLKANMTIPKMELNAYVMGIRLAQVVCKEMGERIRVKTLSVFYRFSDSARVDSDAC